jgi:hypothetical protein
VTPYRLLFWFTPLWLGLLGALTAWSASGWGHERVLGLTEVAAALLSLWRPTRMAGMGLMGLVLIAAAALHLLRGQFPGQIVFYGAVLAFLILEDRRLARPSPV